MTRRDGLRSAAEAWRRGRPFLLRRSVPFGLAILVVVSLPLILLLAHEMSTERSRPSYPSERFASAAVRSLVGPGDGTDAAHVATPDFVRGIYVSAATAGYRKRFDQLVDLVGRTELNSMVIDVKDADGSLSFEPESDSLRPYAAKRPQLGRIAEFTAPLRERGIYLIARIFVFQDPMLAESRPELAVARTGGGLWRDYRGIPWLDPASKEVWKYNVAVAREAYSGGFDEVQFDYIRFPSDGNIGTMSFPVWDRTESKSEVMAGFFGHLDKELRVMSGMPISVDLFGLTMWQHEYDLNIGQKLSDALPHFNFVSPMVYPSHYPANFNGYPNPAARPFDVVYLNLLRGQELHERLAAEASAERLGTFRPWIQDFDLGAVYTPFLVREQMRATEEGGGSGWLLWNARNVYTEAALEPDPDRE
ncbi:MAG: putative glycoside hydrolase [bacterium]